MVYAIFITTFITGKVNLGYIGNSKQKYIFDFMNKRCNRDNKENIINVQN